jgi:LacI family transcriptional regulator
MEILKGVESVLTPAGLLMLLTTTRLGEAEADALASISARGVDGVIMSPHNDAASFAATLAGLGRETPMVFVDTFLKDSKFDYISTDNRKGAFALVSGLVSSGRRKIAYLGSAKPLSALAERFEGYADALKAAGIALDESLIGRTLSGFEAWRPVFRPCSTPLIRRTRFSSKASPTSAPVSSSWPKEA